MTLLPIAAPTTPPSGAGAGEATTTSGDFAALLALVAGIAPPPNGEADLPEVATQAAVPGEPQPGPVEPGPDQAMPPEAVAVVAMPMPAQIAAPAGPPRRAERLTVRVPASPVAVEASPAVAEAPRPPVSETLVPPAPAVAPAPAGVMTTTAPGSPVGLPPVGLEGTPALAERALAEVAPPSRGRSALTVPASPVAAAASPALEELAAAPAPAPAAAPAAGAGAAAAAAPAAAPAPGATEPVDTEILGPPGPAPRHERVAVRVPAAPTAAEASPALLAAPVVAGESPAVSQNSVQEPRVPQRPLPTFAEHVSTPPPAVVTRPEATLPVDAPAPTTVAPPAVPEQIVSVVVPLHGRGDGRHEVTLELRPDELGTIRVEVSLEQQTVHLTLHAAEPATGRLLSAALAELRTALADAGLRAGDLAVSPDGGGATGQRSRPEPRPTGEGRTSSRSTTPATARAVRPAVAGRLDLFL